MPTTSLSTGYTPPGKPCPGLRQWRGSGVQPSQLDLLDLLGLHVGLAVRHITPAGTASGSG